MYVLIVSVVLVFLIAVFLFAAVQLIKKKIEWHDFERLLGAPFYITLALAVFILFNICQYGFMAAYGLTEKSSVYNTPYKDTKYETYAEALFDKCPKIVDSLERGKLTDTDFSTGDALHYQRERGWTGSVDFSFKDYKHRCVFMIDKSLTEITVIKDHCAAYCKKAYQPAPGANYYIYLKTNPASDSSNYIYPNTDID